jgi:carbamoyltransferase
MIILSINFNHDGSALLLDCGIITAYVNTERYSRIKKHPGIREPELDELLSQAGIGLDSVDFIILANLGINFPELEELYHTDFHDSWLSFKLQPDNRTVSLRGKTFPCLVNPDHFLCHSAAAYYFSPFSSAVCFSFDPMGSGAYLGRSNRLDRIPFPETLVGMLYNEVSHHLGFGGVFGAGKTMGLAPYGKKDYLAAVGELAALCAGGVNRGNEYSIRRRLLELGEAETITVSDGSKRWNASQAFLVQELLELVLDRIMDSLFRTILRDKLASRSFVHPNLCLGGGTALNSVANQKCFARSRFAKLYLHPACGDDGTAIGAALYYWHHVLDHPKVTHSNRAAMYGIRDYDANILSSLERFRGEVTWCERSDYIRGAASLLASGKIIGWFQGASEIGPRALGNRSILCTPTGDDTKHILNARVKFRENFRPFAPAVLNEHAEEWFGLSDSPFMLRVAKILQPGLSAVEHCDGTARVQTVAREDNPAYYDLLSAFYQATGIPVLLNTSFNIKGEPIVETPGDALASFLATELDHLVFPGYIVSKRT